MRWRELTALALKSRMQTNKAEGPKKQVPVFPPEPSQARPAPQPTAPQANNGAACAAC